MGRGNLIQARGAIGLANGIRVNRSLMSLILKGNAIGKDPTGIASLCSALQCNFNITHVDFRNNGINNVGARHIGEMLVNNTCITHIDLSWNDFNSDGGLHILEGMKHNSIIVDCQLSGSKCGENTVHEVGGCLRRNRSIAATKAGGASVLVGTESHVDNMLSPPSTGSRDLDRRSRSIPSSPRTIHSPLASSAASIYSPRYQTKARLKMKQREVFLPQDHHFYGHVSDHIDKLEAEAQFHKQSTLQTEARERNMTANFLEREHQLKMDITAQNDILAMNTAEKNHLQQSALLKQTDLHTARDGHARAVQNHVATQQQAHAEEENLQRQIRNVAATNYNLRCELSRHTSDLEILRAETARLRGHVASFERDAHHILAS